MNMLETTRIACPNCGELVKLVVDCSLEQQEYIEDCEVCCHPITLSIQLDADGYPVVTPRSENE